MAAREVGVDYAVSAIVIAALMALLLGFSPNPVNPKVMLGRSAALTLAFGGFANTALVLVASALFLAAAMTSTGLDRRIALSILARTGTTTRQVVIGVILVGFVIASETRRDLISIKRPLPVRAKIACTERHRGCGSMSARRATPARVARPLIHQRKMPP